MAFTRSKTRPNTTPQPVQRIRRAIEEGEVYVSLSDVLATVHTLAGQYEDEQEAFTSQAMQALRMTLSAAYVETPIHTVTFR